MPLKPVRIICAVIVLGLAGTGASATALAKEAHDYVLSGSAPGNNACKGKPKEYVLKIYKVKTSPPVPLRCGTSAFGFNHLLARGRWGDEFDRSIQRTLLSGREVQKAERHTLSRWTICRPVRGTSG